MSRPDLRHEGLDALPARVDHLIVGSGFAGTLRRQLSRFDVEAYDVEPHHQQEAVSP